MKEQLCDMGEKLKETIAKGIGQEAVRISEKAVGKCLVFGIYEPKVPIELLMKKIEK
jgi:hypothetical protein